MFQFFFFVHSSVVGHTSLLHILAIVSFTAMIIDVHMYLWFPDTSSCWHISWNGIVGSWGPLISQKLPHLSPLQLYKFIFAAAVYRVPLFLYRFLPGSLFLFAHFVFWWLVFLMITILIWVWKNFNIVIICFFKGLSILKGFFVLILFANSFLLGSCLFN